MSASPPIGPNARARRRAILEAEGAPLLIHQPSYSMLNRWVEDGLLDALGELGVGCIAFSPLAQGLLTDKYLNGVPADARAAKGGLVRPAPCSSPENLARVRALDAIARSRGQTLAQMAIAWVLARSARHLGADRRAHSWPSSTIRSTRSTISLSPPRNSPPSTSTPPKAASTCGASQSRQR